MGGGAEKVLEDGRDSAYEEVARRHGVALLLLHGSSVTGRVHEHSDVDIAVLYDRPPPSLQKQGELIAELSSRFPGREIDLAILDRADPLFLAKVLQSARLLAGSPRRLSELRIYAFKRYQDHRRFLALEPAYLDRVLSARRA
jgi:predicted nucleotidyltransferase